MRLRETGAQSITELESQNNIPPLRLVREVVKCRT